MARRVIALLAMGTLIAGGCAVGSRQIRYPCKVTDPGLTEYPDSLGYVPLEHLFANPERYNGKTICTEGVYVSAFETSALGASTYRQGDSEYLTRPSIWVQGADFEYKTDCFANRQVRPSMFCCVRVRGVFEYGKRSGHLGSYAYRLGPPAE
jgi:hypothetical protein